MGHPPWVQAVAWATYDTSAPGPGSVTWSLSSDLSSSSTATGDVRPFTVDKGRVWYTHTANMWVVNRLLTLINTVGVKLSSTNPIPLQDRTETKYSVFLSSDKCEW